MLLGLVGGEGGEDGINKVRLELLEVEDHVTVR